MSETEAENTRAIIRRHLTAMADELATSSPLTCHVRTVLGDPIDAVADELTACYQAPSPYMISCLCQVVRHLEETSGCRG